MNMRKCKECGKLFQPKGREQYCSDVHYRPCPVCGKLVEVKYLSDPPRRCENCKSQKIQAAKPLFKLPQSEVTVQDHSEPEPISRQNFNVELPPGKDIRKFIAKDYGNGKKFLPGHLYEVSITKDEYSYWVKACYDWTTFQEVDLTQLFSSMISIDNHFQKLSESSEEEA